ncbi:MAG: protein kinase [Myxococcales bacterium]|nr:protein kinase [Myxococcales bacterium]
MSADDPWRSTAVFHTASQDDSLDETNHPFATDDTKRYESRSLLAEGGMGRVHLVYDRRLRRDVALKSIRPDAGSERGRLVREAWITAHLEHPNIVPVYDAGENHSGEVYYTMRLIRGRTLEDVLNQADSLETRLRFVRHYLAACEAVAYAHKNGIVHRDLKPQNILVGEFGETQVADWGVARPLDTPEGQMWTSLVFTDDAKVTSTNRIIGTPTYMAPEQASGAPPKPTVDVFSLGAILYRLVCGQPPYSGATTADVLEKVRHEPIVPLDVRAPHAPRELCAIAMRATSRDAAKRYPSAVELVRDVANYLDGRRVDAHEYTTRELAVRLLRAWRVPLVIIAVAVAIVTVGAIFSVNRILSERARAVEAELKTRHAYEQADRSLTEAMLSKARHAVQRAQWPEAETLAAEALTLREDPVARGILMAAFGFRPRIEHQVDLPPCRTMVPDLSGQRGLCFAADTSLWQLFPTPKRLWTLPILATGGGFDSDTTFVIAGVDNWVWRRNLADGSPVGSPILAQKADRLFVGYHAAINLWGRVVHLVDYDTHAVSEFAVCAKGYNALAATSGRSRLAVVCDDGTIWIANRQGTDWRQIEGVSPRITGSVLALSPDEARLAVLQDKGNMALLSLVGGPNLNGVDTGLRGARSIGWSKDGSLLLGASTYGATRILAANDGRELLRFPAHFSGYARWTPDSSRVVTMGNKYGASWELPQTFAPQIVGEAFAPGLSGMAVNPDGTLIAAARGTGVVDVYLSSGEKTATVDLGRQTVKRVAFSRDGQRLYAVAMGQTGIQLYDTVTWQSTGRISHGLYRRIEVLPDETIVVASWVQAPEFFAPNGKEYGARLGDLEPCSDMAQDEQVAGDELAMVFLEEGTGRVALWKKIQKQESISILGQWTGATAVALSGNTAAVGMPDSVILIHLDGQTNQSETHIPVGTLRPVVLRFLPKGRLLVSGLEPELLVLDKKGQLAAKLVGHSERLGHAVLNNQTLWTAGWDGTIRRWSLGPLDQSPHQLRNQLMTIWPKGLPEALQGTW